MSNESLAVKVAALKVVSDFTKERYDEARAEAGEHMTAGSRWMARSPIDDTKIGPVVKSDPKPVAKVVDPAALTEWMEQHYPENIKAGYEIAAVESEIVQVLFEHAPHLLKHRKVIKPEVIAEIKRESAVMGCPIGPGGEVDLPGIEIETPEPVVSCRPDPTHALAVVQQLFREGRLELDGTVLPALPASEGTVGA
ncbi:hypothetical protein C8D88_11680 [Lentzea atacamensis]|uniref:Uncharacterized protein n=1 Tax=Lentzea atacamensis TaxID=531938 RepID=A0A316I2M8_9PSEU|nr:hypothetical protein [Lentzea atacamensis]PWK81669.1 hypothetical protein C8D88_11680 [Lentzea atacamensis]